MYLTVSFTTLSYVHSAFLGRFLHSGEQSCFRLKNNNNYSCPSNNTSHVSLLSTNLIRVYKLLPCQFVKKSPVIYCLTSGENHNSLKKKLMLSTKIWQKTEKWKKQSPLLPMPAHQCCDIVYPSGLLISCELGYLFWFLAHDPTNGVRYRTETGDQLNLMLILPHSFPKALKKFKAVIKVSHQWDSNSLFHLCSCESVALLHEEEHREITFYIYISQNIYGMQSLTMAAIA